VILNISRIKSAMTCWRKTFNSYHRGLSGHTRSMNLVDGSAFHKGVAHGFATRNWYGDSGAVGVAKAQFDEDIKEAQILPEEDYLRDAHWQVVKKMMNLFAEQYQREEIQVIQPECEFELEIPGTEHNDITLHWWDKIANCGQWGMPPADKILRREICSPHDIQDPNCACWQPHRLRGRTDAVVSWKGHLWLLEHKTSSIKGDQFWKQWQLDVQLTGYMYAVQRATGLTPRGVVLNMLYKPSENQLAAWNNKRTRGEAKDVTEYMGFEREIFVREKRDLERFEKEFCDWADEWEWRVLNGKFPLENLNAHCYSHNRPCDFYMACLNHDSEDELNSLAFRELDYVDESAQKLIQIQGVA
jgi:hypothetical protein